MSVEILCKVRRVNCRVGSLEKVFSFFVENVDVNCRVGSLEIKSVQTVSGESVNCRVGSLEI